MREIDLTPYAVKVPRLVNGSVAQVEEKYDVKESIISMLFMKGANTKARDAMRWDDLAKKVEAAPEGMFLFEEADWIKLCRGVDQVTDPSRNDIEFLRRVLDAAEVEVKKAE